MIFCVVYFVLVIQNPKSGLYDLVLLLGEVQLSKQVIPRLLVALYLARRRCAFTVANSQTNEAFEQLRYLLPTTHHVQSTQEGSSRKNREMPQVNLCQSSPVQL